MATCHFLYHEGAKVVLQHPVELNGSEEEALALLRFVQAEDLSRCPYVRILYIDMDTVPESAAKILAKVIPCMTGLERLDLGRTEQMFASYPYLLSTFASLRSVKRLVIIEVGERGCEMIRTLQSELFVSNKKVHANALSVEADLFSIRIGWEILATVDANPELTFFPPKVIYENLRTLTLCNTVFPSPIPFIKAFPNLARFSVESTCAPEGGAMGFADFRGMQGPSEDGEPLGWKHLQDFTGRVVDLWTLALTCPIPRMFLEDAPGTRSPHALTDVLALARPMHLTISFSDHPLTDVLGADFLDALRSQGASGLKRLTVVIDLTADDRDLDVGRALDDIATAMSGLQLSHLQLGVKDVGLSETPGETPSAARDRASLSLAERTLDDVDVHEYVK
ncbi:hypothetical protein LXA43DRAFT_1183374 [Ganoderma leucocontextum]|nr:hypothetical protein LXA43DRAFT_1183374 [Ganoderma leucocontextum]